MDSIPIETLIKIFQHVPCFDLGRHQMTVCRHWNSILCQTASIWRNVIIGHQNAKQLITLEGLERISIYSKHSLESIAIFNDDMDKPFGIMIRLLRILELSKLTIKRIQVQVGSYEMDHVEEFQVFKSFPNLKILNVSTCAFPNAITNYQLPGLLTSLGLNLPNDEWFSFTREDLDWLKNLKRLMLTFEDPPDGIPFTLFTIAEVCKDNLIELTTDMSSEEDGCILDLPKLRYLRMLRVDCQDSDNFDGLQFPKLVGISSGVKVMSRLPFFNTIHWFELIVSGLRMEVFYEQFKKTSLLLGTISILHAELTTIKVSAHYVPLENLIDILMMKKRDGSRVFPKLSKMYISSAKYVKMELLVAMMISRRLSKFIDGSCEAITLHLDSKKIVAFRKLEDEMLSRKSIGGERLVGKSLLRNLEEWKDYTLD